MALATHSTDMMLDTQFPNNWGDLLQAWDLDLDFHWEDNPPDLWSFSAAHEHHTSGLSNAISEGLPSSPQASELPTASSSAPGSGSEDRVHPDMEPTHPSAPLVTPAAVPLIQDASRNRPTNIGKEPCLDAQGRLICDRVGCEGIIFPNRVAWKKHMNIHDRPYKCPVTSCTRHSHGFATKGVLERHRAAKHADLTLSQRRREYFCPLQGCHRSNVALKKDPFKRKDHLQEHIRRVHNRVAMQAPVQVRHDLPSLPISQQRTDATNVPSEGPLAKDGLHATTPSPEMRTHTENAGRQSLAIISSADECCEHQREVQELHKKMFDLERRLEKFEAREADSNRKLKTSKERQAKLGELLSDFTKQID